MPSRTKEAFAALLRHGPPVDMEALELHDALTEQIASAVSERDKARAERDAAREEVARLRGALGEIVKVSKGWDIPGAHSNLIAVPNIAHEALQTVPPDEAVP